MTSHDQRNCTVCRIARWGLIVVLGFLAVTYALRWGA